MPVSLWSPPFFFTLIGCDSHSKHTVLSFFLDGVPKIPNTSPLEKKQPASKATPSPSLENSSPPLFLSRHFPYAERECQECHKSQFSQQLKFEGAELCFSCHDDFLDLSKVSNEEEHVVHYPVEEGMCLECHHPHQAKNPFLLLRKGQALCTECHDKEELLEVEPHGDIGSEDCLNCHVPHQGEEKLLR